MKPTRILSRLQTVYRHGGTVAVARAIHKGGLVRLYEHVLDRDLLDVEPDKVGTSADLQNFTVNSKNREFGDEYEATPYSVLSWIFSSLDVDYEDWTFIDIGSGRGRVVFAASKKPFRRVIGVEYAEELHNDAQEFINTASAVGRACNEISLLHADATKFDIPDGPCVFFLFNPFDGEVVEAFLDHVLASYSDNPRPMKFAYYNPIFADPFKLSPELILSQKSIAERLKFALFVPYGYELYETKYVES